MILFTVIVLVLLALALYAISLIPLPGPGFIKPLIQALCVVAAILVIAERAGIGLG